MALEIAEFEGRVQDVNGGINVFNRPGLAVQQVDIEVGANYSDPFDEETRFLRIIASDDCRIVVVPADDSDTDATATSELFPAGEHTLAVNEGMKLSVIAA